ncbi:MAG: hypothetical protein BGP25_05555 [Lysobacterales bacterium 63-13]|nr:MAG: hypothetical protein BGP25_05555 [Xanthomonadales bacterium 63-13]
MNRFQKQNVRLLPSKNKGFTLIELSIAIVAALVLIGIGLYFYNNVKNETGAMNATNGVTAISSAVKALYPNPSYTGLSSALLIQSGKAPQNMVSGTGASATLVNNWGGTVTVAPANYNGGTANAMAITFPSVPRSACNSVFSAAGANFQKIEINNTAVKDDSVPTAATAATVAAACDTENNSMVFTAT